MLAWVLPVVAFVLVNALLGVTTKIALRDLRWQQLLVWTGLCYVVISVVLILDGARFVVTEGSEWAIVMSVMVPSTFVLLFLALGTGDVSRVVPIGAAYPAVTVLAAALLLDEPLTTVRVAGTALVILGVVLVSTEIGGRSGRETETADGEAEPVAEGAGSGSSP